MDDESPGLCFDEESASDVLDLAEDDEEVDVDSTSDLDLAEDSDTQLPPPSASDEPRKRGLSDEQQQGSLLSKSMSVSSHFSGLGTVEVALHVLHANLPEWMAASASWKTAFVLDKTRSCVNALKARLADTDACVFGGDIADCVNDVPPMSQGNLQHIWTSLAGGQCPVQWALHENVPEFDVDLMEELLSDVYSIHSLYVSPSDVGFSMIARPRLYILLLRKGHVKLAADLRETYDKVKAYFRSRIGTSNAAAALIASAEECLAAENELRRRRGLEPVSAASSSAASASASSASASSASDWTYLFLSTMSQLLESEQKRLADFTALRQSKKGVGVSVHSVAMASNGRKLTAPTKKAFQKIPLEDLSLAHDSGWRSIDETFVATLVESITSGQWGQSIFAGVTVLGPSDLSAEDSRRLIDNGKQCVAAFVQVKGSQALYGVQGMRKALREKKKPSSASVSGSESAESDPAWMSDPAVIDILDNGLECQQVEYADWMDRPLQICWQCLCHDESSNQFRKSDIKSVVETCESFKSRCVGGSGIANAHFHLDMLAAFGQGRRSTIYRWVALARSLDKLTIEKLYERRDLGFSLVMENKYFTGQGAEASFKLSTEFAVACLDRLHALQAQDFMQTTQKHYQKVLDTSAGAKGMLARVKDFLQSENGRQKILYCIKNRIPLTGSPDIPESGGTKVQAETQANALVPAHDSGTPTRLCRRMTAGRCANDPAWTKAEELAESQLSRMHIFYNVDRVEFQRQIEGSLMPREKVLLCLDARTSKPKILTDGLLYLVETVVKICGKDYVKVVIPAGSRLELLHILKAKLRDQGMQAYVVQCNMESSRGQTANLPPTYVVRGQGKAFSAESIPGANLKDKDVDPASEINRDDMEERQEDELEVSEAPADADITEAPAAEVSEVDLEQAKDIHCFARPVVWYERMLKEIGHSESTRKVVVLSRTSHPALPVACESVGLEVFCLVEGPNEHSVGHGRELCRSICTPQRSVVSRKRVSPDSVSFLTAVTVPDTEEAMIFAKDVPVSGSWRCGIDVDQTNLAEKVRNLLQSQLVEFSLGIETSPCGRIVVAKKCGCTRSLLATGMALCDVGFTDGLLSVKVQTRNGAGIASGSPLCISFGAMPPTGGLGQSTPMHDSTPVKKFRGTLENYFQESPVSKSASPGTGSVNVEDKQGPAPVVVTASATPTPVPAPEAPKPNPQAECPKPPEAPGKPTAASAQSSMPPSMPPGSVLQHTFRLNDASFNVGFFSSAGKVKVMIVCDVKANKKLPPHCMLACVREGKIVKMPDTASASPGHAVPYKLARQTLVFNRDDLSVSPPPAVSVSALLEKTKAKTLAEHNEQLKPASNKAFVATDTRTQEVLAMAASSDRLAVRWIFKKPASEGGDLSPYGVAIVLSKQLIIKDGSVGQWAIAKHRRAKEDALVLSLIGFLGPVASSSGGGQRHFVALWRAAPVAVNITVCCVVSAGCEVAPEWSPAKALFVPLTQPQLQELVHSNMYEMGKLHVLALESDGKLIKDAFNRAIPRKIRPKLRRETLRIDEEEEHGTPDDELLLVLEGGVQTDSSVGYPVYAGVP
ncbi:hypothetical protein AK812_SmicGene25877 [Symbiodinium microadriaticum]|uniref:Uncharacterized protein n=1 Tax=Symbiodinium microadriaticum TaxID=2951 RepID=A0A1Q9DB18_SYMMI|nr:hypothetical protein AK812_SmicGene25877 [Symbiodinium microadriaticum]